MHKILFIGLGTMGYPMAGHLSKINEVTVIIELYLNRKSGLRSIMVNLFQNYQKLKNDLILLFHVLEMIMI